MLNDARSHGLWERTAPPAPQTEALSGATRAEVAVVGAGYTGLSAALHLAEAGVDVVVLEAAEPGFGGAGRNVGLINAGLWVMPEDLIAQMGELYGNRLLRLLGDGPMLVRQMIARHRIDCEIEANGTLHLAVGDAGEAEIAQRYKQWRRQAAPVELLDAEETARRTGSRAYRGALLDRRAGTLQPLAYARGLAAAAIAAGVRIYTSSPVTGKRRQGEAWQLTTPGGSVSPAKVIVPTDAYGSGPFAMTRREQVHLPYFNLATQPLTEAQLAIILPCREGCWDTVQILSSFRLDRAGRLIFGSVGALRGTGAAIHRAWAQRELKRLFPQLGRVSFEAEWYGKIGMTSDSMPRFHLYGPNMLGISGYNGRGIAPGTTFGRELARLLLREIGEEDMPLPLTDLRRASFRTARELWYEAGAQVAHLAGSRF